jgi:glyoxylase-like metal-dependent hydrolase (beta-lactamase superfamily II)
MKNPERRLAIFLAAFLAASSCVKAPQSALYEIKYGESKDMDWIFYLLELDGRKVLIDCGFDDPDQSRPFNVDFSPPSEVLAGLGIRPESVTDILVTHAHFDHLGTVDDWPKARIWIHQDALSALLKKPFSKKTADYLSSDERVRTFRESTSPFPGVAFRYSGLHSPGSCMVTIDFPKRRVILTGDEFRRRSEWTDPGNSALGPEARALARELVAAEASGTLVLTMHESIAAPSADGVCYSITSVYPRLAKR